MTDDSAPNPDIAPDSDASPVELQERIVQLLEELEGKQEEILRHIAAFENHKRREAAQRDAKFRAYMGKAMTDFFEVGDALHRCRTWLETAPSQSVSPEDMAAGLESIEVSYFGALAKHKLEPIVAVGEPFDSAIHEAIAFMPSPTYAKGTVTHEHEKGYRQNGEVVRFAKVVVSSGSDGKES